MAIPHVLILHGGGLRSLVAAALALDEAQRVRLTLLHIADGRAAGPKRLAHVRRQGEHFHLPPSRVRVLEVSGAREQSDPQDENARPAAEPKAPPGPTRALAGPRMLLAALAEARDAGAQRVVFPAACDGSADAAAHATEQAELCGHLAESEDPAMPRLELPLVELSDQQVIELGARLEVPWELAWSCLHPGEMPCRVCEGCRRRRQAFDQAGLVDPQTG